MRLGILWTIFIREATDLLRDRRTVISLIVLPLLVFPLLSFVGVKALDSITKKSEAEATTVAVKAGATGPDLEQAIAKSGLTRVERDDLRAAVESKRASCAAEQAGKKITIYADNSVMASSIAARRLREALGEVRDERVRQTLAGAGLDAAATLRPFAVEPVNVATERKMSGTVLGMLGYIIVLLMFQGGMYAAIDLTAGEKERKTLETLLATPAGRNEIVLAKILVAAAGTVFTALLTLVGLGASFKYGIASLDQKASKFLGNVTIDALTIGQIFLTVLPLAIMAGALMIAIACFARSFKEAQSYLTPLILAVIFPSLLGGLPGLEMTPALALIPIFNASQLIKEIMQGEVRPVVFWITMGANFTYAAICFYVAVRVFKDESVMFRT